jgi:hypothetical protein
MRVLSPLVLALLAAAPAVAQQPEDVGISQVPGVVMSGAGKAAPSMEWLFAFKYKILGDNKEGYELVGKDLAKRNVVLMIFADGKVVDIRTEIQADEVPKVVSDALKANKPDFTPKVYKAVGTKENETLYYRFEGELPGGKKTVMIVRTDGKKVLEIK